MDPPRKLGVWVVTYPRKLEWEGCIPQEAGCPRKLPAQVVKAGFIYMLFTSRVSGRGYRNGAVCVSVCVCECVCVCVFVSALTAESFDIWSPNLVQGLTLIISRTSVLVKVKDQGHDVQKRHFQDFLI